MFWHDLLLTAKAMPVVIFMSFELNLWQFNTIDK